MLGVAVGLVVTLLMLAGVQIFVPLDWSRFGLWLLAILAGGAALGGRRGGARRGARDVRAVSLLAFMISLPVALLSLVPSGAVGARALRSDPRRHRPVPLQAGAAGDDRGPRLDRPGHRRAADPPGDPDRRLWPVARLALRRFASV